jgi:hypothetical protein
LVLRTTTHSSRERRSSNLFLSRDKRGKLGEKFRRDETDETERQDRHRGSQTDEETADRQNLVWFIHYLTAERRKEEIFVLCRVFVGLCAFPPFLDQASHLVLSYSSLALSCLTLVLCRVLSYVVRGFFLCRTTFEMEGEKDSLFLVLVLSLSLSLTLYVLVFSLNPNQAPTPHPLPFSLVLPSSPFS